MGEAKIENRRRKHIQCFEDNGNMSEAGDKLRKSIIQKGVGHGLSLTQCWRLQPEDDNPNRLK